MKYLILINIIIGLWAQFNKINVTNNIKIQAEKYYKNKDYKKAIILYDSLILSYQIEDEEIRLNLANMLFLEEERKRSVIQYQILSNSKNAKIRSIAFQQLGVILAQKGKYENALIHFKESLKTNPKNEKARYNFELVKKLYDQESSLNQEKNKGGNNESRKDSDAAKSGDQNKEESTFKKSNAGGSQKTSLGNRKDNGSILLNSNSGEQKEQSNGPNHLDEKKETKSKADEEGDKESEALKSRRLNELKISEEKAKMILELMKNKEVQYLQERKKTLHKEDYKNKPDW